MGDYRLDTKKYYIIYDSKNNYKFFWIILPFLWDYISYFWTCFDTSIKQVCHTHYYYVT